MGENSFLKHLSQEVYHHHKAQKNILSFDEYLNEITSAPQNHVRNASVYILDAIEFFQKRFGTTDPEVFFSEARDDATDALGQDLTVFGHADVINTLLQSIDSAFREGVPQRLLLLHGPNGSGKTSIIQKLMGLLEAYATTDEGKIYTFNWIFPTRDISGKHMGLNSELSQTNTSQRESYAHLPSEVIQCMIRSETKESPLFLIPPTHRSDLWAALEAVISKTPPKKDGSLEEPPLKRFQLLRKYFMEGSLSARNQSIFEALLKSYDGDIQKVYQHVQVERFYLNRKNLSGLVTIEPITHVDATIRQISMEKNYQNLPPVLQSINLYELQGELISGSRGLIEFNDLLKRPIESFKYLLTTCESGKLRVGPVDIQLDSVLIGSCNEKQIEAFKEYPDFPSFKARMDLIQTPFLLNYLDEAKIYKPLIDQLSMNKPFTPHALTLISLWAVLSRLKKPHTQDIPDTFKSDVNTLSCLGKAYLYAKQYDKVPFVTPNPDQLDTLRTLLRKQYQFVPMYEGRVGASPREVKNLLMRAFKRSSGSSVTFRAISEELDELTQRVSEFEFLRQEPIEDYHNSREHIVLIRNLALTHADEAFRTSIGIYDESKIDAYMKKYFVHLSHVFKKEKIRNPETHKMEDPDHQFLEEFENRIGIDRHAVFQDKIMNQLASLHLSHPQQALNLKSAFPHIRDSLIRSFYTDKKPEMLKTIQHIRHLSSQELSGDERSIARRTKDIMEQKFGYTDECLDEALGWLQKLYS